MNIENMTDIVDEDSPRDFNTICRICVQNEGTVSIFSESESENEYTLQERIMSFAYVEIFEGDGLPTHVCKKCVLQINRAFKLKAQCEYADAWLRQCLAIFLEDEEDVNETVQSTIDASNNDPSETGSLPGNATSDKTETSNVPLSKEPMQIIHKEEVNITEVVKTKPPAPVMADHNIPLVITRDNSEIFNDTSEEPRIQIVVPSNKKHNRAVQKNHRKSPRTRHQPEEVHKSEEPRIQIVVPSNKKHNRAVQKNHRKSPRTRHQPEEVHKCVFCDREFALQGSLVNHLREHEPTGEFRCIECGRAFPHEILLDFHVKTHTAERPHCCSHCGKCFMQLSTLISHERNHTRRRAFLCSHCGKMLTSTKQHICPMLHEKREKMYQCTECGKKFMRLSTLNTHKKRHGLVERFRCKTCYKPFYSSQELLRHTNVHLGIRPFACKMLECTHTFYTQGELNRHMRYHKGEKKFQCDLCKQTFYESGHLVNHRRKHTGERPFVCHVCYKTFADASKLKRHTAIHSVHPSRRTSKNNRQKNGFSEHLVSDDDRYDQTLGRTWAMLSQGATGEETIEIQGEEVLESEEIC